MSQKKWKYQEKKQWLPTKCDDQIRGKYYSDHDLPNHSNRIEFRNKTYGHGNKLEHQHTHKYNNTWKTNRKSEKFAYLGCWIKNDLHPNFMKMTAAQQPHSENNNGTQICQKRRVLDLSVWSGDLDYESGYNEPS